MTTTFSYEETVTLVTIQCGQCGLLFGVPQRWQRARVEDRATFYCPNGHTRSYIGKTEAEQLREQVEAKDRRLAAAQGTITHLRDQVDAAERSVRAQRGVNTKLRKRVANGVCPCCSRAFVNVARHMAGQHPDFAVDAEAGR